MISVKIDYHLKCMNCLYEEPEIQSRTWTKNRSNSDSVSEIEVSYEQASTMLRQLLYNVVCKKCQRHDQLGFLILKANEKIFNTINPKQKTEIDASSIDEIMKSKFLIERTSNNSDIESETNRCNYSELIELVHTQLTIFRFVAGDDITNKSIQKEISEYIDNFKYKIYELNRYKQIELKWEPDGTYIDFNIYKL
jgi:hypothetical protein